MPHLELLFPYKLHFYVQEAQAAEATEPTVEAAPVEEPTGEAQVDKTEAVSEETTVATASAAGSEDTSGAAGASGVSFKVDDFTGAGHLGYPMVVPPGRNGLAPKVSLDYSSSGGNGWVGVGFDLQTGFIQRRGPKKAVPKYDSADIFELNLGGAPQELVCTANCPPTVGIREYRLRIEGAYLKITHDVSANKWTVLDKSGTKLTFGSGLNSRIGLDKDPADSTRTYRWFLDRVDDPKTNYMEFIYWRDQDATRTFQVYPQEIRYNGRVFGTLPHNHKVIFTLEGTDRSDPIYNYRGGFRMLTRKRLSTIEIKTNDVPVRKYVLQYRDPFSVQAAYSVRSLLWKLTHYGYDTGSQTYQPLPATVFSYQGIDNGPDQTKRGFEGNYPGTPWPKNLSNGEIGTNFIRNNRTDGYVTYGTSTDVMDMDGDGRADRVVNDGTPPHDTWEVYKNTGSAFNTSAIPWSNQSGINDIRKYCYWTCADVIDLDGDGLPDRVLSATEANPLAPWTVYLNNRSGFDSAGTTWANPSVWWITDEYGTYYYGFEVREGGSSISADVIDLDGDGLPDRLVYEGVPANYWSVYLNNGVNGFTDISSPNWHNPSYNAAEPGSQYIRNETSYGTRYDLIDMNNDGLPDRVSFMKNFSQPPNSNWKVYFNTGSGFDPDYVSWPNPSAWGSNKANHIRDNKWDVIDLNGDGLPDRVVYEDNYTYVAGQPALWKVYLNTGKGFHTQPVIWRNPSTWSSNGGNVIRETGTYGTKADVFDLDGDGLPDRVVYDRTSPYDTWSFYRNKGPVTDLLVKVENGIGGTTEISYLPSTAYKDPQTGNQLNSIPLIVQTVATYTRKDGKGASYITEYQYAGADYDPVEVEFRGFETVTSCQSLCGANPCQPLCSNYESKTVTTFLQDYYTKGKMERQVLYAKASEGHTREVVNNWDVLDVSGTVKFPRLLDTIPSPRASRLRVQAEALPVRNGWTMTAQRETS